MGCSTPGLPVLHYFLEVAQTHVHWVGNAIQPSHPLLFLPSIFPRIRFFSKESALHMKWPKYWGFSFSISPYNEYSGLISFRIFWLDLLGSLRYSQESSPGSQFKSISSSKKQASFNFMAAVTVHSDFGAQENEICHCFQFFSIYLPRSDGSRCHDLCFLNVEF